jgi:hypothetical protein
MTEGFAFTAQAGGEIPEEIELRFATTDRQGGNYTHGAEAVLELVIDGR